MISQKEIEVRYNETDQMRVVYHANYVIWCELARLQFLRDLGFEYSELEDRGILFPVHDVQVKYMKPCRYGEKIIVHTKLQSFSPVKTVYTHEIRNDKDELKASAMTSVTCVNREDFRLVRLDKAAPDVYETYKKLTTSESIE